MKKYAIVLLLVIISSSIAEGQKVKVYEAVSPGGSVTLKVEAGPKMLWSVQHKGVQILIPSAISMQTDKEEILGDNVRILSAKTIAINTSFNAINYRKSIVTDKCTQLTINCKGDYGVIFRVYDDAVAYRFFTRRPGELIIKNEEATFNFTDDHKAFIPIQWDYRDGKIFNNSFENTYREIRISKFPSDSLAFLPVLVDAGQRKIEIFEIDLEDYPGMYLDVNESGKGFKGVFAQYPLETYIKERNIIPSKRADYIAKTTGNRDFPWRAVFISENDKQLLDIDLVQKLASPSRLEDISWIKTGQVAWDWWNDLNISHVDFKSGMNTPTYKYYIDFAAKYGIPYILFDEGWNVPGDLTKVKSDINLNELVAYGKERGVGIIVWCQWKDVLSHMEKAFSFFEQSGVKGMKIDFIDRDDQIAVKSLYEIPRIAAQYHLFVDYHGVYKPTGLQRTYPNVVGIEGVYGLETFKWANRDAPRYVVSLPFIRNQAGPMDYTSGSMRNATRSDFRPVFSTPMSQGTRVNQLAQYIIFEVPMQMLSDNPTIYLREHECTEFITKIPTSFEEIVPLEGKVAEYVAIARRRGTTWYAGAMTNWTPRELIIDCSFLGDGEYQAEIFSDGVNADRDATDYRKEIRTVKAGEKLKIKLMDGGGWAARFEKK